LFFLSRDEGGAEKSEKSVSSAVFIDEDDAQDATMGSEVDAEEADE
jgi:hypothetical protein